MDDTTSVPEQPQTRVCPFCAPETYSKAITQMGSVFAILDINPVSTGHMLIIPRRHVADFFDMTPQEWCDAAALLREMRQRIASQDPTIGGFNAGVNYGKVAGQTVMHTHIHLIPRRQGDTPNPRGGVRGAVPEKMSY